MEIWRDITGYEGLYQVSNKGKIKSLHYGKEKILKPRKVKKGYLSISLHKDNKSRSFRVHRLVGKEFIPNPYNLPQINHIDEIKTNNCVENLEWCSAEYNDNYGTRNERISKSKRKK